MKRESQMRGSMHVHTLLYLKDSPKFKDENDYSKIVEFIDKYVTCEYDPKNPLMTFERHKHTFS